jgi:lantibiotic modifying enzyme
LHGGFRDRALEAVHAVAIALQQATPAGFSTAEHESQLIAERASLARGHAGLAILYGTLADAGMGDYRHAAVEMLEQAVDAMNAAKMAPSLFAGFTGIAWAAAFLDASDDEGEDVNEAVDRILWEHVERCGEREGYDLISGLAGIGVYALERLPRPDAAAAVARIVAWLDEAAARLPDGISWFTAPDSLPPNTRQEYRRGFYNLGVAHGVPGVIAFLGRVVAAGLKVETAGVLLQGAVDWLLAQKLPESAGANYASVIGPGIEPAPARSAWCYGDPGIAAALLIAARATNNEVWERKALAIGRTAVQRSPERAGIFDACLCHGAAGLGHLFNRIFQRTGDEAFAHAARFWFERALDTRRPGEGIAGFCTWKGGRSPGAGWIVQPGFLDGAAGIALALLAAATPFEPAWDRAMLVS